LGWNKSSKISVYWLSFVKSSPEKLNYEAHKDLFHKSPEKYSIDYAVIMRDVDEGRTDLEVWNFSMRSFLFKLQSMRKVSILEARENMKHVLEALLVKYPQIGYCQGMNYIIGFLLCFANEEQTFELFSDLVDRVLPSRFFQKSEKGTGLLGVLTERHVLKRLLQDADLFKNAEDLQKANDFLDLKAPQWLLSLLVNILDFEGTFCVFNLLFEWGFFSQVEKTVLLIIKWKFEEFCSYGNDSTRITDSITRDINISVLQGMNDIPVDERMRAISYMEYMKEFAEKWNQTDKLTHRQLEKITYFSKEEIQVLQKEFLFLVEDRVKHHSKKPKKTGKNVLMNMESSPEIGFENYNENTEKKNDKTIKGITKNDFSVILSLMNKRESEILTNDDLDRIFDAFDDDKSGTLDFREFLCCMSLLIKGNINEKLEMCFSIFDRENKGYLRNEEAVRMIDSLRKSLGLTLKGESVFSTEDLNSFEERLFGKIEGKEKITLLEFAGLENDSLVSEIVKKKKAQNHEK